MRAAIYARKSNEDNDRNAAGEQVKAHTDFKINTEQAEIVRGIFRMYAEGYGHTANAKTLNGEPKYQNESLRYFSGAVPKPPQSGTRSWGPSCIRAMLYRRRYIGVIKCGRVKKVRANGSTKKRVKGDKVTETERPDLRIVEERLNRQPEQVPKLETEIKRLTKELDRFMALSAAGSAPASVLEEIHRREEFLKTLELDLMRYQEPSVLSHIDCSTRYTCIFNAKRLGRG